jgi:hypothetical protein
VRLRQRGRRRLRVGEQRLLQALRLLVIETHPSSFYILECLSLLMMVMVAGWTERVCKRVAVCMYVCIRVIL